MSEPLTDEQLMGYRELADRLAFTERRSGLPCDMIDAQYLQAARDAEADGVIRALLDEVALQRGFANELIAQVVSGLSGTTSAGAAREIRARLDGARKNEKLQAELDGIIAVCADAGIGSEGQSALDRVKELHKALGEQIDEANRGSNP